MMGSAMLKRHQFVRSLWASYGVPFGTGRNVYAGEASAALVNTNKVVAMCTYT